MGSYRYKQHNERSFVEGDMVASIVSQVCGEIATGRKILSWYPYTTCNSMHCGKRFTRFSYNFRWQGPCRVQFKNVRSLQGDEAEVIIFSTTKNNYTGYAPFTRLLFTAQGVDVRLLYVTSRDLWTTCISSAMSSSCLMSLKIGAVFWIVFVTSKWLLWFVPYLYLLCVIP